MSCYMLSHRGLWVKSSQKTPLTVLSCINMPNAAIVWQNLVHDF
jgi:hypothetical protein